MKSAGVISPRRASGPSPAPRAPWQPAQLSANIVAPARRRRGRGRQGLEHDAGPLRHELDEGLDPIRHVGVSGILADRGRERRQVGGRQQSQPIVHLPRLGETQARLLELGERLQLGAAILEGFEICQPHAGQELEEAANVCRTIVGAAMGRGDERRQQEEPREGGDQKRDGNRERALRGDRAEAGGLGAGALMQLWLESSVPEKRPRTVAPSNDSTVTWNGPTV